MARVTIILAFGLISAVFADPEGGFKLNSPITEQQLEDFKEDLEEQTKDGSVTCENYRIVCEKTGNTDPNSVCQITLKGWLCDNLRTLDGVRQIVARVEKLQPGAINLSAGQNLEPEPDE